MVVVNGKQQTRPTVRRSCHDVVGIGSASHNSDREVLDQGFRTPSFHFSVNQYNQALMVLGIVRASWWATTHFKTRLNEEAVFPTLTLPPHLLYLHRSLKRDLGDNAYWTMDFIQSVIILEKGIVPEFFSFVQCDKTSAVSSLRAGICKFREHGVSIAGMILQSFHSDFPNVVIIEPFETNGSGITDFEPSIVALELKALLELSSVFAPRLQFRISNAIGTRPSTVFSRAVLKIVRCPAIRSQNFQ